MKIAERVLKLHGINESKVDKDMLNAYLAAMLWASNDYENGGEPFDSNFDISDISKDAVKKSEKDIAKFLKNASKELDTIEDMDVEQIGHDIFLSRNGHGAGFFDRDYADQKILDKLQSHAEKLGSTDVYSSNGSVEIG